MFCFWKDFFVTTSRDSQFGSFSSPVKVRCLLEQLRSLRHSTHAVLEWMPCLSLGWNIFRHCPWAVFLPDVGTAAAKSTNGRRCNGTGGRVDCDDEGREVKFNEAQIKSKKNWLPFLLATGWTSLPSAGNKECHWWRSCCSSHGGDLQQMEGISEGQEDSDGKSADVSRFHHFCCKMQDPAQPSGICPLISSESFNCLNIISLMCNIILLPSLGGWRTTKFLLAYDCTCLPDFLAFRFLAFISWLRSL